MKIRHSDIIRNIYLLYIIKCSKWFMLMMPVIVLFYQSNGLSMSEILTIQGIYSLSIVVFEIPSGYLADVWGRKNTIVIGSILGFAGYMVYSLNYSFSGFIIAEIILGMAQSCISGADSALLYDTLIMNNSEKQYTKFEGRVTSLGNIAEAAAGITGGFLALYSLRTPVYFQTGISLIAIPASLYLTEPVIHNMSKLNKLTGFTDIIKTALWKNKKLMLNIMYSSVVGASTLTMAWFVQPFFNAIELPLNMYGILWTLLNLSVGITSLMLFRIQKHLTNLQLNLIITIALPVMYILTGLFQANFAILFIFIFYIVRGIATPLLKDSVNVLCSSEMRATVLSIRGFVIRIFFSITGPALGWVNDFYSLSAALIIAGIMFFVITSIFLILLIVSGQFSSRSANVKT